MFQFCSGVTDQLVPGQSNVGGSIPPHSRAVLRWPVLLAANCVVGCFLAALAIGYTFFLTWDKHIIAFFTNTESRDQLVAANSYDVALNKTANESLCQRCSAKSKTSANVANPSNGINACSELKQFSTSATTIIQKTCGISQVSLTGSNYECTPDDYKKDCVQCLWEHKGRCCKNVGVNSYSNCPSLCSGHQVGKLATSHDTRNLSDVLSNYNSSENNVQIFSNVNCDFTVPGPAKHFPLSNAITVCNDPDCQREQLRYEKQVAEDRIIFSDSVEFYPIYQTQPSSNEMIQYFYPNKLSSNYMPQGKCEVYTEHSNGSNYLYKHDDDEHLYSNLLSQDLDHSEDFSTLQKNTSSDVVKRSALRKTNACQNYCACYNNQALNKMADRKGSDRYNQYIPPNSEVFSMTSQVEVKNLSLHQTEHDFRLDRCSTLPAKFSRRASYFSSNGEYPSKYPGKYFQSTLDVRNGNFRKSSEYLHSLNSQLGGMSWRNSSVPSLKRNVDEFGSRKSVKSVKFVEPEDSDDSADQFDGSRRRLSRRECQPPDGSSGSPQPCSDIYRD